MYKQYKYFTKSPRRELNSRPPVYKTGALPLSYKGNCMVSHHIVYIDYFFNLLNN